MAVEEVGRLKRERDREREREIETKKRNITDKHITEDGKEALNIHNYCGNTD